MNREEVRQTEGFKVAQGHALAAKQAADAVAKSGDLDAIAEALVVVNAAEKHIDERRKIDKQPSLDEGRAVDSEYKELASPLKGFAEKLRERVGELAAETGTGTIHPANGGTITPTSGRRFEVEEPSKLPKKFRLPPQPDERAIKAAVDGGADEIPGVRIWTEHGATVRR